jgi:hypothetical protein
LLVESIDGSIEHLSFSVGDTAPQHPGRSGTFGDKKHLLRVDKFPFFFSFLISHFPELLMCRIGRYGPLYQLLLYQNKSVRGVINSLTPPEPFPIDYFFFLYTRNLRSQYIHSTVYRTKHIKSHTPTLPHIRTTSNSHDRTLTSPNCRSSALITSAHHPARTPVRLRDRSRQV